MSGGKGGKTKTPSLEQQMAAQQQAIEMSRPKPINLQTEGYGGMGINLPANPMGMGTKVTGQGLNAPGWMQGDWAMPAWGQQAPNVGAAMMQQAQMGQYAPQASAPGGGKGKAGKLSRSTNPGSPTGEFSPWAQAIQARIGQTGNGQWNPPAQKVSPNLGKGPAGLGQMDQQTLQNLYGLGQNSPQG